MTPGERTAAAARYWLAKARDALASARDEHRAGRLGFAMNRCYYAAFYAASAVLLWKGERFVKHTGVRAALHRRLVKGGAIPAEWGSFYNQLFRDRQQGDYVEFVAFEATDVGDTIAKTESFVTLLEALLPATPQ